MHGGNAAPTGPSATAAAAATAAGAAAATGADAAATAADAAAPAADVTAVDVAVARMGVGTAISSPRTGAQPPTAIKGTGTSTNDRVGPTGSVATCPIGSGSVCTVGGTANSRTGSGTPAPRVGPTGNVATMGSVATSIRCGIVCNFGIAASTKETVRKRGGAESSADEEVCNETS